MKHRPRQGQIRVLKNKGADFRSANTLLDWLKRGEMTSWHFDSMTSFHDVPKDTAEWLLGLSKEERARLRIVTNSMADSLYSTGRGWVGFKQARHILTGTFVAYPEPGRGLPRKIEFMQKEESGKMRRHVFYCRGFEGRKVALAFDDPIIHDRTHRMTRDPMSVYEPRGMVSVIEDLPSCSGWYFNDNDPQLLVPLVERRYLNRLSDMAWFGPVVRSAFKVFTTHGAVSKPRNLEGKKMHKKTLYVGYDLGHSTFGVLVELPGEPLEERKVLLLPPKREEPAQEAPLTERTMREIHGILSARTKEFIRSPAEAARLSDEDLVGRFHNIGHAHPSRLEDLRQGVSEASYWEYVQHSRNYTLDEWHSTYSRLCQALGVPTIAQWKGSS